MTATSPSKFKVEIQEREYEAAFSCITEIDGDFRCDYITNKDPGHVMYSQNKSIVEVIQYLKQNPKLARKETRKMLDNININGSKAEINMTGVCRFKYGVFTNIRTEHDGGH